MYEDEPEAGSFPLAWDSYWCGEHPRFGDYLAATRKAKGPAAAEGRVHVDSLFRDPHAGVRARKACRRLNVEYADQLIDVTEQQIAGQKNTGAQTVVYMAARLSEVGVVLKGMAPERAEKCRQAWEFSKTKASGHTMAGGMRLAGLA